MQNQPCLGHAEVRPMEAAPTRRVLQLSRAGNLSQHLEVYCLADLNLTQGPLRSIKASPLSRQETATVPSWRIERGWKLVRARQLVTWAYCCRRMVPLTRQRPCGAGVASLAMANVPSI